MTKFKKLTIAKRLFAMALAATMALSLSTVQTFAADSSQEVGIGGDVQILSNTQVPTRDSQTQTDPTTGSSEDPDGTSATTDSDATTGTTGGGTTTATDSSATTGTTEAPSTTNTATDNTQQTTSAAEPKPVGTLFREGSYEYKVTSANTVTLMGFAGTAEATYVKVKKQVTYDGVTYIVNQIATKAFVKESCIEKVLIRKNVEIIGRRAFFQCKNLETVRIKTGLKTMRKCAFKGCKALRVVNIQSGVVEEIKANAFKNVNTNLVINVATKSIKRMLKDSVPSYVTINKAFSAPKDDSSNTTTDNNTNTTTDNNNTSASTAASTEASTATTSTAAASTTTEATTSAQ